ncbi:hypothetical protein KKG45_00890 [bacterium]|nr:hypothetical protein [bacterium]MBU1071781.1 hypothetical protein [bacterium]MBU1674539.1 hypothetical protein [bacterium]
MDLDILNLLESGNKTMAWLGAVALAAGGTAIIVAVYIQLQRWRLRLPGLTWPPRPPWRKPEAAEGAARLRPRDASASPEVKTVSIEAGLAAYRAVRDAGQPHPGRMAKEEQGLEALDALLRRLHRAASALEEIALKSGRLSGAHVAYDSFVTGLDVEYLHRQN